MPIMIKTYLKWIYDSKLFEVGIFRFLVILSHDTKSNYTIEVKSCVKITNKSFPQCVIK